MPPAASVAEARASLGVGEISDRAAGGPDNVFGYDGYVFAPELQRYCVRFRWYDPATGRWMERDPGGYVDGANLYEMAVSDPISLTDPLGLDITSSGLTKQKKQRLKKSIDRVGKRVQELRAQLLVLMNSLSPCELDAIRDDLKLFSDQLEAVRGALSSRNTNIVVRIVEGDIGISAEGETQQTFRAIVLKVRLIFSTGHAVPPTVMTTTLNTNAMNDWSTWSDAQLDEVLLHELMHTGEAVLGRPDQDGSGTIFDPYKVEKLMSTDMKDWTQMKSLIKKAQSACQCEEEQAKEGQAKTESPSKGSK